MGFLVDDEANEGDRTVTDEMGIKILLCDGNWDVSDEDFVAAVLFLLS
jgi:hypothetical protein